MEKWRKGDPRQISQLEQSNKCGKAHSGVSVLLSTVRDPAWLERLKKSEVGTEDTNGA